MASFKNSDYANDYANIKATGWLGVGSGGVRPQGFGNEFFVEHRPSVGRFCNDLLISSSSVQGSKNNGGSMVPGISKSMAPPTNFQGSRLADLQAHPSGSGSGTRTVKPLFNPLPKNKYD